MDDTIYNQIREQRMAEVIKTYFLKTSAPVVAVLGAHHIRDESAIHPILQAAHISYLVVDLSYDIYGNNYIN